MNFNGIFGIYEILSQGFTTKSVFTMKTLNLRLGCPNLKFCACRSAFSPPELISTCGFICHHWHQITSCGPIGSEKFVGPRLYFHGY